MNAKNEMPVSYLKDGYLVVGCVRQQGCTTYKQDDKVETRQGEILDAEWKTFKNCRSVDEEKAVSEKTYALNKLIYSLGVRIANFGTLVPLERAQELEQALKAIRDVKNTTAIRT